MFPKVLPSSDSLGQGEYEFYHSSLGTVNTDSRGQGL